MFDWDGTNLYHVFYVQRISVHKGLAPRIEVWVTLLVSAVLWVLAWLGLGLLGGLVSPSATPIICWIGAVIAGCGAFTMALTNNHTEWKLLFLLQVVGFLFFLLVGFIASLVEVALVPRHEIGED